MPSNDPDVAEKPNGDNWPTRPARNPGHGHSDALLLYGDGSDGVVNFDGTTTVLGLAPTTKVYTLTRDIFLADGSAIQTGVTIKAAGYRVYARGLINALTLVGTANIDNSGAAAVTSTGGAAATTGVTFGGAAAAGGNSSSTTGTAGTNVTNSFGGAGGAGGAGSSGAGAAASTSGAPAASLGTIHSWPGFLFGGSFPANATPFKGGAGGSGGSGDSTHVGGAGGGGGGPLFVAAETLTGTGSITANGGAGAAGNATGNNGGGGGGGGGFVVVATTSGSGGNIPGITVTAAGGAPGAGTGTGVAGLVGAVGTVVVLN